MEYYQKKKDFDTQNKKDREMEKERGNPLIQWLMTSGGLRDLDF